MTNSLLQHSCSLHTISVPNFSRLAFYPFFFQAGPLSSSISSLVDDGHWPSSDIPIPGWPSPSYLNIFLGSILSKFLCYLHFLCLVTNAVLQ